MKEEKKEKYDDCEYHDHTWCKSPKRCKHRQRVGEIGPRGGVSFKNKSYICEPHAL